MGEWKTRIRCYVSPAQNNKISEWYTRLSKQGKSDADTFLRMMRLISDWQMPFYRPQLKAVKGAKSRDLKGIGELRWTSQDVEHRLLGFFADGVWNAVIGCTHK